MGKLKALLHDPSPEARALVAALEAADNRDGPERDVDHDHPADLDRETDDAEDCDDDDAPADEGVADGATPSDIVDDVDREDQHETADDRVRRRVHQLRRLTPAAPGARR